VNLAWSPEGRDPRLAASNRKRRADVLTGADLALLATEPDGTLPRQVAGAVNDAIDALEQRMDDLAALVHIVRRWR
jgi:hypothetical protein